MAEKKAEKFDVLGAALDVRAGRKPFKDVPEAHRADVAAALASDARLSQAATTRRMEKRTAPFLLREHLLFKAG